MLTRRLKLVKRRELLATTTSISEQNDTICMNDLNPSIFTVSQVIRSIQPNVQSSLFKLINEDGSYSDRVITLKKSNLEGDSKIGEKQRIMITVKDVTDEQDNFEAQKRDTEYVVMHSNYHNQLEKTVSASHNLISEAIKRE